MGKINGWWFGREDNRLRYFDGRGREVGIGVEHTVEGKIVPCRRGLHLSPRIIDALKYAPGPMIWRVEGSGTIVPHGSPVDKYACSRRKYISGGVDASAILRKFARMCALDVIHLWDAPDIVVQYLENGNDLIRGEAYDAAWAAAFATRGMDFGGAARSAAYAASRPVDLYATEAADWAAVVATDMTRNDAKTKQNRRLTAMVSAAIRKHSA